MAQSQKNSIEQSANPTETPRRIAYFPKESPVRFEQEKPPEKLVMTFPNLIIREVICFQVVVIVIALLALIFNAPLEELANPQHTPNPAKAPWYFLGLQELLHNFPPFVAGVLLPLLVVIALVIIPYFEVNTIREGLWLNNRRRTFINLSAVAWLSAVITASFDAYSIAVPTLLLYGIAIIPYFIKRESGWINWLERRSLAEWVMTWFVFTATLLTLIGTFFRGPGWSWVWPWG